MKEYRGLWLPEGEEHLIEWMETVAKRPDAAKFFPIIDGKPTYQAHKFMAALKWCGRRRAAVDIGAHAGLWSRVMALHFWRVTGFEPMPEHAACWRRNMAGKSGVELHEVALGDREGQAYIKCRTPGSSGDTGVEPDGTDGVKVEIKRLDDYKLAVVDFLKIDCEGYEVFILRGAEETLKRCRPCVIVEQKPESGMEARYKVGARDAVDYLISLGAKLRDGIQGDYILNWD